MSFLKVAAQGFVKVILKTGANILAGGLPLGDVCSEVWDYYTKSGKSEAEIKNEVQQASDPNAVKQIPQIVQEVAGDQTPDVQQTLQLCLQQVPGCIQRSLRNRQDPTGRTIPAHLTLRKAGDLAPALPDRMPRFRPGDRPILGGDLVLDELLGVGGFGEVWKAHHEDRPDYPPVAMKYCLDATAVQSLRNEMRLLDKVASQVKGEKGIVQLLDANLRAEPPYLKYEYVAGGDLGGLVLEYHLHKMATWENIARLMHRLARIIGVAHAQDIVHRDLKPDNILTHRGSNGVEMKVADFGIGGISASQEIKKWEKTRLMEEGLDGAYTPLYSSSQQRSGAKAVPQDDVYSLGVIWYQAQLGDLTKEPPTGGGWRKRFADQGVPMSVIELIESCMDADPTDRPTNANDLADKISALLPVATAVPPPLTPQQPTTASPAIPVASVLPELKPLGAGAAVMEPPLKSSPNLTGDTTVRLHLPGIGGDRGKDHIEVFFDGRSLGWGCATAGFDFQVGTKPGGHTVEVHGHAKQHIPLLGERKFKEFKSVYPIQLPQAGMYEVGFRFGTLVRFAGVTAPNIMEVKYVPTPNAEPQLLATKKLYPGRWVALVATVTLVPLFLGFGLLMALLFGGPGRISSSSTTYLSFKPSSLQMSTGESKEVRVVVPSYPRRSSNIYIKLQAPSHVQVTPSRLKVEPGQEEAVFTVTTTVETGAYTITAEVEGESHSYPPTCRVTVIRGPTGKP